MRWLPIFFSFSIATVTLTGAVNPHLAFTLLPLLAAAVFVWVVAEGVKELNHSGAFQLERKAPPSRWIPADLAVEPRMGPAHPGPAASRSEDQAKGGYSAVA